MILTLTLPNLWHNEHNAKIFKGYRMFSLHKSYVLDENHQPIAVQIPIAEFEQLEEILENFGLLQLMAEMDASERLPKAAALKYYQGLINVCY